MPDSLRTTISQFSSSGGRVLARATNARTVEPAADLPGAERGNLYVLLEVTGSGGGHAALYRQILNAVQQAYYEMGDTVEAALRQAIRAAHAVLRRANEALPEAGWRAGVSCVAYVGGELVIAQAGPSLALISHPQTVDQFPGQISVAGMTLGGDDRPETEIFRSNVEPGSILLLAQSDWLIHVTSEALAVAAAAERVPLAADYLGQLAGQADLSALLVGFGGSAIPEVVDEPAAPLPGRAPAVGAESGEAIGGLTAGAGRLAEGMRRVFKPEPVGREPAASAEPRPRPSLFGRRAPEEEEEAPIRKAAARAPMPATGGVGAASAELAERVEAEEPGRRSAWPLVLALIGIPLVIAVVVIAMLWYRTRANETRFQETLTGAAAAINEAKVAGDEGTARLRLDAARDYLDKARAQRPDDVELAKLQAQYTEDLNRVNHVTPLYGMTPLWDFRETGRRLERVLAAGDSLFVLDQGRQEVLRFVLSQLRDSVTPADQAAVIHRGQQIGDPAAGSGQVLIVSDLVDMTWAEAVTNQRSRLLVLDTAGGLASYDVTYAAVKAPMAALDQGSLPQLIMSYGGNLYVVDTKANQIWRYRPSDKGYENAPEKYFTAGVQVDLAGVQAMAIDGNIWLLFADGRLLKFYTGDQKPFEFKGLPDPLRAPTAVVAPVGGEQIYIADAGNGRIVEFNKDGKFLRQFRPTQGDLLRDMRGLFLDEAGGRFYILTGDKLYKADLPKPEAGTTPGQ
ncbi:MAG: hypothetical protein NT169_06705 [Chloroflexi bacterium]|nr:hypothetical protein [Chloroflexota bacterium]